MNLQVISGVIDMVKPEIGFAAMTPKLQRVWLRDHKLKPFLDPEIPVSDSMKGLLAKLVIAEEGTSVDELKEILSAEALPEPEPQPSGEPPEPEAEPEPEPQPSGEPEGEPENEGEPEDSTQPPQPGADGGPLPEPEPVNTDKAAAATKQPQASVAPTETVPTELIILVVALLFVVAGLVAYLWF